MLCIQLQICHLRQSIILLMFAWKPSVVPDLPAGEMSQFVHLEYEIL